MCFLQNEVFILISGHNLSCHRLFTLGPIGLAAIGVACVHAKEMYSRVKHEGVATYTIKDRNRHRRLILILTGFLFFSPTSVVIFQTFVW